ncbi:TIGR03557 family F420-dependent LLM class oxidoreductase [Agromyces seonyuensis]|uniref:TIGR03557 family F420-dependent LLM class oxidoreductase n=1 Tax=Agromyces seonyuensis TaxID=2662446 RepID=A0A6I4P611_9MICO|nr:TIGR03557 family F420-dependent LLM class oxidoreductase [Agromyces seonyuensis]MWB98974.1 TIGR03557 family F420-dependent LLM class oxidoreductase [Agromyces seonyuensis]
MVQIGYAAALEQFAPMEAVALAVEAERNGFSGVMAADHFQPWTPHQGQASFVWNVLTAIAERTSGDVGPGVTAPTFRWHPAMVAQASATLSAMYPGRHWLGIGSGEALNEHVVAPYWPEAPERIDRMFEAVDVIKKLFASGLAGRDVRHRGTHFTLESTRLWTMPAVAPEIFVAASGPVTARRAGRTVDGLITVGAPVEKVAGLLARFADGAREAGRDPSSLTRVLQLHLSWAATQEEAEANALREWPTEGMRFPKSELRSPYEFEAIARHVRVEDFEGRMLVSADPDAHRARIQSFIDLGFERIYLHNAGRNQREWLEVFGRDVLPKLHS